ncbi:MAG: GatB/YqeY domain-containing protein [Bacteroidales bacterium]|nr:GatB/YqeY domain-containing protein [Bacteroidales bacterium]
MKLSNQVNEDIKSAMKARDKVTLEALRAVKTAFTLARTQEGSKNELSDEEEHKIIQRLVKQRKDSAAIYQQQAREDLYQKEIEEVEVLEKYLPEKMSNEELESYLKGLIEKTGASGMQDMGKVMGTATVELAGKAEGKEIAGMVRKLLSN